MRGYYRIKPEGTNGRKTGEQILTLVEKQLRKAGIPFVEDCTADVVIVRYGEYTDDAIWDAANAVPASEREPVLV